MQFYKILISDINHKNVMNFQLKNSLQIFAILTYYFVNIWTLNAYQQKLWLTIFDFFLLR